MLDRSSPGSLFSTCGAAKLRPPSTERVYAEEATARPVVEEVVLIGYMMCTEPSGPAATAALLMEKPQTSPSVGFTRTGCEKLCPPSPECAYMRLANDW